MSLQQIKRVKFNCSIQGLHRQVLLPDICLTLWPCCLIAVTADKRLLADLQEVTVSGQIGTGILDE